MFSYYLLISLPLQFYLFLRSRRFVREKFAGSKGRDSLVALNAFLFLVLLVPLACRVFAGSSYDALESSEFRSLFYATSIWGVGAIGCAIVLLGYNWFRRVNPSVPAAVPDASRREFLKRSVNFAAAAPFAVSGYGVLLERRQFSIERFEIAINELPESLSQLRVVQLTDVHAGPFMSSEDLKQYAEAVNELKPDLIVLTGDFVTGELDEAVICAEGLAALTARFGVFACMGNHDIHAGADVRLTQLFAKHGIHTLRNDGVTLTTDAGKISILGIDDLKLGKPDLAGAWRALGDDPGDFRILLSHRPEIFPQAAQAGIDLVVSGHYHGGQVKLHTGSESPSVARFLTPYAEGLYSLQSANSERAAQLFVGRGIGTSGLPIRVNCPPQIAELVLTKA